MYTPLKVTTDYSILSSLIKIKDLINFCVQNNFTSCAICDTNLFGTIEFYKICEKNNIKPIIGLEIKLNKNKLYLYAKNYLGYKNLLKINTIINEREISILELKNLSDNILCIIPYASREIYNDLDFINYRYLGYENKDELQNSLIITEKVIYVNDIRCFKLEDQKYFKYLNLLKEEEREFQHAYFDYHDLTEFDLMQITNFVDLIDVKIPFGKRYIPKYLKDGDSFHYLTNLCLKGLKKRLNNQVPQIYLERLKYELSVINKMDFVDYFLIVYDYVLYAKKNNILVGPGRGSAAGSLVSYVIGITNIDPLKYNLLFERFLNYERVSMPDIDIDFDNTKRDLVINYVKEKYGSLCVSGGITFATLRTRLVLREVGRLLKIDEKLLNRFIKVMNKDLSLRTNLKNKEVNAYLDTYPELKKMYEISLKLEGLKKNISTHAAGIVIADRPLDEIIPMYKDGDVYLTGVTMDHLEDLGLLKMDFLALKNLSTISKIISQIPNFDLNKIPLDDKKVYELFCNANTEGIFQFETNSFRSMLRQYRPQNFSELVASIALVRPGPSQELATYIRRKNGQEKITYYHPSLKDILSDTYGVIVYQEQVIMILVKMAGFSYAEADNIRRAMAKKKMDIILKEKDNFIKRSIKNGYSLDLANNIFNHILAFADYGFNKAHSVAYALVSYEMAYLKVHYPALFTFEALNDNAGSVEKVKSYLSDLKKAGYKISPVHINYSNLSFLEKNNIILLPFKMLKGFPSESAKAIIEERNKNGVFQDVWDFFRRTYNILNKNDYLILINAGALKYFGLNTKTLIANLDSFINFGSLYQDLGEYALRPEITKEKDYENNVLRELEINSYGFFISNHPASKFVSNEIMKMAKIKTYVFKNCLCYVMIEEIKKVKNKNGEAMAFLRASDETGTNEFIIFSKNCYLLNGLQKNDLIKVNGYVTKRYDKYNIIINNLSKEK